MLALFIIKVQGDRMTKQNNTQETTLADLPNWDLSHLYHSPEDKALQADINHITQRCADFAAKYKDKVSLLDSEELANAICEYEQIEDMLGKISSYAQLLYADDMNNPQNSQFYQNIQEQITTLTSQNLFFTLQLNKIDDDKLHAYYQQSKKIAKYWPWIQEIRRLRPYQLEADLERLLHEKSVTGNLAWNRMFDESLAKLRFPFNGEKLTVEEICDKMTDCNQEIRKKAAKSFGKILGSNNNHFSLIINTLVKDKAIEDKWRGFKQPIESRNIANSVENEVVESLLTTVQRNYPTLSHRYYRLKASWFGRKKLHYWDRNAPLPEVQEKIYQWQEAKELVISAYNNFSVEMAQLGERFFTENWIDAPVRPGKASGAFAHPTVPSAHPYIMLNYLGRARDVMTLAHELGHGVHQLLSAQQGALMADTPLTLAETASVFGEQLTFQELLKRTSERKQRRALLASKVEDMLNTVVRQIAFCQFEIQLHQERKQGELTAERINEIWLHTQQESLGEAIILDKEYAYYWSYIPHFIHTPFYVYAYAFGDCLVNSLYALYQNYSAQGRAKEFETKYLDMLRAGGSLRHKELLKPFGLDATDSEFWQQGLNVISRMIDELEQE